MIEAWKKVKVPVQLLTYVKQVEEKVYIVFIQ
jgi:hypothetical protein